MYIHQETLALYNKESLWYEENERLRHETFLSLLLQTCRFCLSLRVWSSLLHCLGVWAKVGSASLELNGIPYARLCNPPRTVWAESLNSFSRAWQCRIQCSVQVPCSTWGQLRWLYVSTRRATHSRTSWSGFCGPLPTLPPHHHSLIRSQSALAAAVRHV